MPLDDESDEPAILPTGLDQKMALEKARLLKLVFKIKQERGRNSAKDFVETLHVELTGLIEPRSE